MITIDVTEIKQLIALDDKYSHLSEAFQELVNIKLPFDEFKVTCRLEDENRQLINEKVHMIFDKKHDHKFSVKTIVEFVAFGIQEMFYYEISTNELDQIIFERNKDGRIVIPVEPLGLLKKEKDEKAIERMFNADLSYLFTALFSVSLMNCKNVNLEEIDPVKKMSRQVKRNLIRKNKPLPEKYHVLNIMPFNTKKYLSSTHNNTSPKGLHFCRGHFRTYKEKKLFGKVEGTFWIPFHVKGSKENGVIQKDYKIKK